MIADQHEPGYETRPGPLASAAPSDLVRLLTAYRRIAAALARSAGPSRFYLTMLDEICRVVETDRAHLCQVSEGDRQMLRVVAGAGALARLEGALLPIHGSFEGEVLSASVVHEVTDLGTDLDYFRTPEHRRAIGPALAIRLGAADAPTGVLVAARKPGAPPFEPRHRELLTEIGSFIGSGMAIGDQIVSERGGRTAVEAWQEMRATREWLAVYEEVLADQAVVAVRIHPGEGVEWGRETTRVFGEAAEPLVESVDALLDLVPPTDRAVVQATVRDLLRGDASGARTVTCTIDAGIEGMRSIRLKLWRGRAPSGVVGTLLAGSSDSPDPDEPRDASTRSLPDPVMETEGDTRGGDVSRIETLPHTVIGTRSRQSEVAPPGIAAEEAIAGSIMPATEPTEMSPAPASSDSSDALIEFGPEALTDIHSHLLVGVDDGAAKEPEALTALARAHAAGIRSIIVTPHVRISTSNESDREAVITRAFERLTEIAAERHPDLRIYRGAEVMLDVPRTDLSPDWLRLAGTRFALVEFAGMWIPPRSVDVVRGLIEAGYSPIIAHPERYENAELSGRDALEWREAGARLQVNCGALLGMYGQRPRERAWRLIEAGAVDYLASDYHSRGSYPVEECIALLESHGGAEQAKRLMITNPSRLLRGDDPIEVEPVRRPPSLLQRIANARFFW